MKNTKARVLLDTFDYDGVRLLPGRCAEQAAQTREVYFALPDDDILKGFRQRAGLPAPGAGMRGWCAETSSCIFGQLLSGMARLSRATGDAPLRHKALALFDGWRKTVLPGGDAAMRLYDWEKLVCGLVDLHAYAGSGDALPALAESTAWADRTFDRTRRPADNFHFQGDGPRQTIEWYTLPENLYRAYLLGGDPGFKAFAGQWLYEDYWRRFAESADPGGVVAVHAYSHVNSFSSAAMAYAVSGDRRYLDVCVHAYDFLQTTQCYATGGYGPDERLMPPDGALGRSLELYAGHAEIPCGSWAAFKLSRYLMMFTGEARFGDWMETLLYNGIGAALPTEPDGRTYYYGDYRLSSGIKQYYWYEWPCCSGTYLQTVADYHNVIYFRDAAGLYVNLFVPSEATWQYGGQSLTARLDTQYPESETATVTLSMDWPVRMTLAFRVPGWSRGVRLAVNGAPVAVEARPGTWARVEREWQPGDRVTVTIPLALRTLPVDAQHPRRAAILWGPIVLAQDEACCRRPLALEPGTDLRDRLVQESPARFRILDAAPERHTRFLQPYYEFPAFRPYWVYFDLDALPLY